MDLMVRGGSSPLRRMQRSPAKTRGFSLGVQVARSAVALFGRVEGFDPYLVEWHRAAKRDRPSGTARDLARRITAGHPRLTAPDDLEVVSIRAGASPGMHLVGFDATGETLEIRLTARDRSAYAAGILASIDWLARTPRPAGLHTFETIVDELIARQPVDVSPIAVSSAA